MDLNLPGSPSDDEEAPCFLPRRGNRLELDEVAQMRCQGSTVIEVRVHDLSTGGFMATCLRPVLIGSYVTLDLPGIGPVHAQVRWQVGGKLGGRFLDPVSLHRCHWVTAQSG